MDGKTTADLAEMINRRENFARTPWECVPCQEFPETEYVPDEKSSSSGSRTQLEQWPCDWRWRWIRCPPVTSRVTGGSKGVWVRRQEAGGELRMKVSHEEALARP